MKLTIPVEYDAINGIPIPDGCVDQTYADIIGGVYPADKLRFSTDNIIARLRVGHIEEEIVLVLKYEGKDVPLNAYASPGIWPKGLCDTAPRLAEQIIRAVAHKRRNP